VRVGAKGDPCTGLVVVVVSKTTEKEKKKKEKKDKAPQVIDDHGGRELAG
jgi:hypothetical protein